MQIVNTGNTYRIYTDAIKTYGKLPAQTYTIGYSDFSGTFLEKAPSFELQEKVYGTHLNKAQKVLNSFKRMNRNLGVILSGEKGIGKSLCARIMAIKAIEEGLPVIIVDSPIPGLASFINSIEQECLLFFDEFEKTFGNKDDQVELLTLFDGTSVGKKLFVVTCNKISGLNDVMINRPGRFHYHFRFAPPTDEEVKEYMQDKVDPCYWDEIDKVLRFNSLVGLNYDCLRAIAFELNSGAAFKDVIQDLNIINVGRTNYKMKLYMNNGEVLRDEESFNLVESEEDTTCWRYYGSDFEIVVTYKLKDRKAGLNNTFYIDKDNMKVVTFAWDDEDIPHGEQPMPIRLEFKADTYEPLHYYLDF